MKFLAVMLALAGLALVPRADAAVVVTLADEATLQSDGQAVEIAVTVSCSRQENVLEAFVYIVQDGNQSPFAGIPIRKCKDRPLVYIIRVPAPPGTSFHAGSATATAFVLVQDPATGTTESGSDNRAVEIR